MKEVTLEFFKQGYTAEDCRNCDEYEACGYYWGVHAKMDINTNINV